MVAQAAATVPAGSPPRMGAALLNFAVLGASTVTNTGPTVITGDLGVSPGTAVTGFPPGIVHGTYLSAGAVAAQAQLTTAYNDAAAAAATSNLTGQDLGTLGHSLSPGVYKFNTSAQLTGTLTLSGSGVYIFQIGSTLTTAPTTATTPLSQVLLTNGAQACAVYWQVGSSATLDNGTHFQGNLMALASITMNAGANIVTGRALARTGAVTMITNTITKPIGTCTSAPGSCNQGKSKDKDGDENADKSKDTEDSHKSGDSATVGASLSSKDDGKDENGKQDSDKGNKNGCNSDNSNHGDNKQSKDS
jgi:type VI secretion system secreted protein VgrG